MGFPLETFLYISNKVIVRLILYTDAQKTLDIKSQVDCCFRLRWKANGLISLGDICVLGLSNYNAMKNY